MNNFISLLALFARIAFIYLGTNEWFQPNPDRIFSILCFIMVSCISIERDIVAIRGAFETLLDDSELKNKMGSELQKYVYNNNDVSNGFVPLMQSLKTISDNSYNKFKKPDYYQLSDIYNGIPKIRSFITAETICPDRKSTRLNSSH